MVTKGLLLRIRACKADASSVERSIINYIEQDPQVVVAQSIRNLAENTNTSVSSVVRFCKKLGCAGYKEFQRELVIEVASQEEAPETALEDIQSGDSTREVVRKVMSSNVRAIEVTSRLIDLDTLEHCAQEIIDCRAVDLFGVGASLLVANDLQLKLARADKPCNLFDDWHNQLLCAKNMHADDLAIVFSYSGMTGEMIEAARHAHANGAKVIAVTRAVGAGRLADEADYVLGVAASEPLVRSGAMGSRMSQLMVVDALWALYVTKDYDRTTSIMLKNYDVKK